MEVTYEFGQIPQLLFEVAERGGQSSQDRAGALFGSYFQRNSGRLFDEIVMTTDRMRFEYGDIVAISMLSVDLHAEGIATLLLDRRFSAECSELLRAIPVDRALWDVPSSVIDADSEAVLLWSMIKDRVKGTKAGFTVISKLLAAKRPHLFPVWDVLVDGLVPRPEGRLWEPMRDLLIDEATRRRLVDLTSGAPQHVTLLRRIDVALWREADRRRRHAAATT